MKIKLISIARVKHERIVVKIKEEYENNKTAGGIYIPKQDDKMQPPRIAEITSSCVTDKLPEGMLILISRYAGVDASKCAIMSGGTIVINTDDILAKVVVED